jgi:hypothetical protein
LVNSKGFPVLGNHHSKIAKEFMKLGTRMILTPRFPTEDMEKQYNYLTFLFSKHDKLDEENRCEVTYRNYL